MRINVYNLDGEAFVAAKNYEQAVRAFLDYDYEYDPRENELNRLTKRQLDYYDFLNESGERICSFREQLNNMIRDKEKFPAMFAVRI